MRRPIRAMKWSTAVAFATASVLAVGAPAPAAAQDHDLVMFSLDANPKPLPRGCSASLTASFLINGHMDDLLASGAAEIRFYWADGGSPVPSSASGWNSIGALPVTWAASDGPFAIGREWPTGFASVAGSSRSWTVPSGPTSFHIKAEAVYTGTGVSDAFPANNQMVAASVPSVAGTCPTSPCCTHTAVGMLCWKCIDPEIFRIPVAKLQCLLDPGCKPFAPIPICQIIDCNPCLMGLTCPPEPWDVLIRWPDQVMRVELVADGEVIARSRPLRQPVRRDGETFYQSIRFVPRKGVEYGLQTLAGPKAEVGKVYPLRVRVLGAREGSK